MPDQAQTFAPPQAEGLSVIQSAAFAGISRAKLYEEVKAGNLKVRKLGKRSIILRSDLLAWLHALPVLKAA